MKLNLSEKRFQIDHEAFLEKGYTYGHYITDKDKVKLYDKRVCSVKCLEKRELSEKYGHMIEILVSEETLKKVLKSNNEVEILPVPYNDDLLAVGTKNKKIKEIINRRYIDIEYDYNCFFYEKIFYFFAYLPAEPEMEMEIDKDAFMFVYMVAGKEFDKKEIHILQELNKLCKKLRGKY